MTREFSQKRGALKTVRLSAHPQRNDQTRIDSWVQGLILGCVSDVTRILDRVQQGDPEAAEQLLPLVYDELRKLASAKMAQQSPGQTLQATALVHEACLKLTGNETSTWRNRQHFFRAAAEAMRHILVDRARAQQRAKHGGGLVAINLEDVDVATNAEPDTLLLVDEAVQRLAAEHPDNAELVKLRFFAGLTLEEAAAFLGLARRTADRYWAYARAWLYEALRQQDSSIVEENQKID